MTIYVNPATGKDNAVGSAVSPLKTLTKALSRSIGETAIQLAAGTYDIANGEVFPLKIPKGIAVLGNESVEGRGVIISGSGQYNSPTFQRQNVLLLLEDEAQLRGITVTNQANKGTGVWLESASPFIARNTFTNCGREGIFVTGKSKPVIQDNLFIGNASAGIFLVRNAKGEVRRNAFQETGYGITLSDHSAPLIAENKLINNRIGIYLSRHSRPVLRRNLIEKNSSGGLVVTGDAQPDFGNSQDPAGNILRDNTPDLRQETKLNLISVGNQLNPAKVKGEVSFVATKVGSRLGPSNFRDISGHWAETFISKLVDRGSISGFPDGTFRPQASLTRAEYAALIAKSFDLPRKVAAGTWLKDVQSDFWAINAIQKAAAMGFISGFPDGTFRPQNNLTRIQAIVSLVSGLGLVGGNPNLLLSYGDRAAIPSYATNALATATQRGLVVNYPQTSRLEPLRDITRAEVAALIYQALVTTGTAEVTNSPYIVTSDLDLPSFSDIQQHWAKEFITRLGEMNLVRGLADGSYKPDTFINRAQYAALLVSVFNPQPIRPATQFIDVPYDFWGSNAIQQAYRAGFISGFPDQTFHPNQNLRRIHLIVSLASGLALPQADEEILDYYEDGYNIAPYALAAAAAATKAKIVVNYPDPKQIDDLREVTRGEATAMVYQGLVYRGQVKSFDSPYISATT
ncbi:MAG: S-layer homology domain-containing protein [Spirulinaceae cyanobacterium]